jgi:hypothetical protein
MCFEQVYYSSSGATILYIQQLHLCWLAASRIMVAASQHKCMTHTNCCIARIEPPDDEQCTCSKLVEADY